MGEFLHAMAFMGFNARKMYGSAWYFDPVKPDIGHGILFHEPHPGGVDGKIMLRNAVAIRRRLRHAFGWCGDMVFVTKGLEAGAFHWKKWRS